MSIFSTQSGLIGFVSAFCSDVAMYDRSLPWDASISRRKLRRMSKRRLKKYVKKCMKMNLAPLFDVPTLPGSWHIPLPFHQSTQES